MEVQLHKVLHMNGGDGEFSYATNSLLQKKTLLKAKAILQESIVELYKKNFPECITMADMGCSSGSNTFMPIWEVIQAIDETCQQLNRKPPILQVFLNDLPENDFNSVFRSLPSFFKKLEKERGGLFGSCFVAAMPGNFYGRLFPPHFLHFVHSSWSIHWRSELPNITANKGNIYLAKTSSHEVHKAYLHQFRKDFNAFLKCRSEEMIVGGCMVLTIFGRDDIPNSSHQYKPNIWELFGLSLNDMVKEGLIEESKLDSFNMPIYTPSAEELREVIEEEGSFDIKKLESFEIGWEEGMDDTCKDSKDKYRKGKNFSNRIRCTSESIFANHFGSELIDVIFERFAVDIGNHMETVNGAYINHVVSITKN